MKLGAYTACLHDLPLSEALKTLADMGLTSAEVNSGGFLPAPHLPIAELLESADARSEYLGGTPTPGVELTALNCNGNPLDPDAGGRASRPTTCSPRSSWRRCSASSAS